MSTQQLKRFLAWNAIINTGFLMLMAPLWLLAGEQIYRLHSRWFPMRKETFSAIFYGFIGFYKIMIYMFNIVPWLALVLSQTADDCDR